MNEQEQAAQQIHTYLNTMAKKRTQRDISNLIQSLGNKLNAIQQLTDKHQFTFLLHFFTRAQIKTFQKGEILFYMDKNSDKYYMQLMGQTLIYTYTPKEGFEYNSNDEKSKKKYGKTQINQDFLDLDFIQQYYQVIQETCYVGDLLGDIVKPQQNQIAILQSNSIFAVYTQDDYKNYEMNMVQMENREKYRYLSQHHIFQSLSNDLLIKIAQLMKTQTYVQKQLVYREDDPAELVYFIKKGEFKMFKKIQEKYDNGEYLFIQYQKFKKIEIASLLELEIFGLEDLSPKRIYQVVCVSQRGLVYAASIKQGQNEEIQRLFNNQTYSLKQQIYQEREDNIKKIMIQDEGKKGSDRSQCRNRTLNQMQKNKRNNNSYDEDANDWLIKKQLGKTLNNTQLEINDAFQYQSEPPTCRTIRGHKIKHSDGELTDIDQFEKKIESKQTVLRRYSNNYSFDCRLNIYDQIIKQDRIN